MPYEITQEGRGRIWRFFGKVTMEEFSELDDSTSSDPNIDELRYLIVDFRAADLLLSEKDAQIIGAKDTGTSLSNPYIKIAVIGKSEKLKKLVSLYSEHSPLETRLFENLKDARSWISNQG